MSQLWEGETLGPVFISWLFVVFRYVTITVALGCGGQAILVEFIYTCSVVLWFLYWYVTFSVVVLISWVNINLPSYPVTNRTQLVLQHPTKDIGSTCLCGCSYCGCQYSSEWVIMGRLIGLTNILCMQVLAKSTCK